MVVNVGERGSLVEPIELTSARKVERQCQNRPLDDGIPSRICLNRAEKWDRQSELAGVGTAAEPGETGEHRNQPSNSGMKAVETG